MIYYLHTLIQLQHLTIFYLLLVVVAEDASDRTKKEYRDACAYYNVPLVLYGTKETLGHAMGEELRSGMAVLDEGLARAILPGIRKGKTEKE